MDSTGKHDRHGRQDSLLAKISLETPANLFDSVLSKSSIWAFRSTRASSLDCRREQEEAEDEETIGSSYNGGDELLASFLLLEAMVVVLVVARERLRGWKQAETRVPQGV